jgi:hypothetical protein
MVSILGFDQLQRQLAEAQDALSKMNGEIGKLRFDPADPGAVEAAVQTLERMVDDAAGRYASNPIVIPFVAKSKEAFAAAIRAKAASRR